MSDDVTFNLKAVINKEKTRVLFAEVGNQFADVLLSFLTLPLGRIVQILGKHYGDDTPIIGSLNTLYNGVSNLDCSHFKSYNDKLMLLNPESAYASPFRNMNLSFHGSESTYYELGEAYTGNFIDYSVSFIISDDLWIVPNVKRSVIESLDTVGIAMADLDGAETRNVTFGVDEFMDFLKGSLVSRHPLTDVILGRTSCINSSAVKFEPLISLDHIEEVIISNFRTTTLIAMFEKSTKKFLFAQADQGFVDFLFSLLLAPLGRVEMLLGANTGLPNIDNLYTSVAYLLDEELLNGADTKEWLLGFLSLTEAKSWLTSYYFWGTIFVDQRPRMYMITDDLTVTPLCVSSTLTLLNQMNVLSSEVEEEIIEIGIEEALGILKASLTSNCAMTDGLNNLILEKQRKLEQPICRCRH